MAKCVVCGKEFRKRQSTQKYCSFACKYQVQRANTLKRYHETHVNITDYEKVCEYCHKKYITGREYQKYCSETCRTLADKQRRIDKPVREKSPFYKPTIPDGYDWNDYGMPTHNEYLDKWEKDIPWYQAQNSILMSIDPYPVS